MANYQSVKPIVFQMVDSTTGLSVTGKTVTGFIIRDGATGVALTGTFTEVTNGGGTYKYVPLVTDLVCDQYTFRFVASGCRDKYVEGATSSSVVTNTRGEVNLNTKLSTF